MCGFYYYKILSFRPVLTRLTSYSQHGSDTTLSRPASGAGSDGDFGVGFQMGIICVGDNGFTSQRVGAGLGIMHLWVGDLGRVVTLQIETRLAPWLPTAVGRRPLAAAGRRRPPGCQDRSSPWRRKAPGTRAELAGQRGTRGPEFPGLRVASAAPAALGRSPGGSCSSSSPSAYSAPAACSSRSLRLRWSIPWVEEGGGLEQAASVGIQVTVVAAGTTVE
jgi:hypothetical protein